MNLHWRRLLTIAWRRRRLKNHGFTILSNRCIGGVMTHNVGERFRSPTVNLIIPDEAFMEFCRHVSEYADCPMEQPDEAERRRCPSVKCPIGILRGAEKSLPDIPVFFVHFQSFEQAKEKWETRFLRVNYDDLYIMMDCKLYATDQLLDSFHQLPFEHKVIFSSREDPQRWPCNFPFSFYLQGTGGLYAPIRRGLLEYQGIDEFDYVQWLNDGIIRRTDIRLPEEGPGHDSI